MWSLLWSFFFFKQKTAYEMRISDWSSDVCSSDLVGSRAAPCGVSFTRRAPRSSKVTFSAASSLRIWWLMAPWVTFNSLAALDTEPRRAAASKARRGLSGGRLTDIGEAVTCEVFSQETLRQCQLI